MDKRKKWKRLSNPDCMDCSLCESAQRICIMGRGNLNADIVIVGEAPGFREDDVGRPFAGRSGKLLDEVLGQLGWDRKDLYISNVVQCRPPNNRTPSKKEIDTCVKYLKAELDLIRPKLIIPMGNTPLKALTRRGGITKYRGRMLEYEGDDWKAQVLPTYHPAYILRSPGKLDDFVFDLEKALGIIEGSVKYEQIKYKIIKTIPKLKQLIKKIQAQGFTGFDVETTSLNFWDKSKTLCTIGFSWKDNTGHVVPIFHSESPFTETQIRKEVLPLLEKGIFNNPDVLKIAHNFKFDGKWLMRYKVKIGDGQFDTMLAHYSLDENSRHDLDSLSLRYTDYGEYWKGVGKLGLGAGKAYHIPLEILAKYNAIDCDVTQRLYHIFDAELDKIPKVRNVFDMILMPMSDIYMRAEFRGMLIDTIYLGFLLSKFERDLNKLYGDMIVDRRCQKVQQELMDIKESEGKKYGEFNFNSAQQLSCLLFTSKKGFRYPVLEKTETGQPSTAEEVLNLLIYNPDLETKILEKLVKYKKTMKLYSTYIKGMYKHLDDNGRVHPVFKIHGTVTGRPSCATPNLQQIPRVTTNPYVKKIFVSPKGYTLVEWDLSQAELRIMTYFSKDKEMMRWFREGIDVHTATAAKKYGIEPGQVTKAQRKQAKTINFAIIYCVGNETLAEDLSDPSKGIYYTSDQAGVFMDEYFQLFPRVKKAIARLQGRAEKKGYAETLFGRRRRLPDIYSEKKYIRSEALRQSVNAPVQGTASDFILFSLCMLHGKVDGKNRIPKDVVFVNSVHDSMMFYVPDKKVKSTGIKFKEVGENLPTRKHFGFESVVPIVVECEHGNNWGEMVGLEV